ncbi:unnamed protein product [Didymodactylos carnosus]|uniref:DUF4246 domain-containing protein n=1 Tax=Didymodactylos carnosus TaxID=1234261 RepID=A0A814YZD7_9BILA|nr:unnamed protein product [Didymodactylos carnosus]CAF3997436.1 unnamed protein product [Didymodactylos carnosus]
MSEIRHELWRTFKKLNKERQDVHDYPSPVEDIIDPDLLVYQPDGVTQNSSGYYEPKPRSGTMAGYERLPLRSTYRWIPSEFRICPSPSDSNGLVEYKVHIETPILHLPMNEQYEQAYRNLEKIFEKLVPMFKKLNVLNTGEVDTRLQVIVKVQSYNVKPGIKYSGRWHTEGYKENIVAVGVYYLHIDRALEGGALKFRPSELPYADYGGPGRPVILGDEEDWRLRYSRNCFQEDVNRYAMPKTDTAISKNKQELPDLFIEKILAFLSLSQRIWPTDFGSKEFRRCVRSEMCNQKPSWKGISYGNWGNIDFIKFEQDIRGAKNEHLFTTSTDTNDTT